MKDYPSYRKEGSRGESFIPIYVRIKERILDKRDSLIDSFNDYYKVCVIKKRVAPQKYDNWILALISMFIEIKDKFDNKVEDEKQFKDRVELIITKKITVNPEEAYNLQNFLLSWLESSGLTKIGIDKRDIIQQLEDEENDF